jgi:hypothetical protein
MKPIFFLTLCAFFWMAHPAAATVYQYTDENGSIHYTNDLSSIPLDKLPRAIEHKEYESDSTSEPSVTPEPSRSYDETIPEEQPADRKNNEALKMEYQQLLKEKEAIDNDESFQKRKEKRKYKHRPYIKDMVEKEKNIIDRLKEVELMMDTKQPDTK